MLSPLCALCCEQQDQAFLRRIRGANEPSESITLVGDGGAPLPSFPPPARRRDGGGPPGSSGPRLMSRLAGPPPPPLPMGPPPGSQVPPPFMGEGRRERGGRGERGARGGSGGADRGGSGGSGGGMADDRGGGGQRAVATVMVTQLPEDAMNLKGQLQTHFQKFGTVTEARPSFASVLSPLTIHAPGLRSLPPNFL